ncbi:MAG: 5-(carboxyamino)imidazole ribonucleotide mutase [Cytophagales bacterium]
MENAQVAIIMGSDSDLSVMKDAAVILEEFLIPYELTVVSAHRTPERMFDFAKNARKNGLKVIIAGAGGAAHLPGMVASLTSLPVIGVPIKASNSLEGFDSILSILQMPGGVPVATVALNGAKNAGLLALQILSTFDLSIAQKLDAYKESMNNAVIEKANALEKSGWKSFIKS